MAASGRLPLSFSWLERTQLCLNFNIYQVCTLIERYGLLPLPLGFPPLCANFFYCKILICNVAKKFPISPDSHPLGKSHFPPSLLLPPVTAPVPTYHARSIWTTLLSYHGVPGERWGWEGRGAFVELTSIYWTLCSHFPIHNLLVKSSWFYWCSTEWRTMSRPSPLL